MAAAAWYSHAWLMTAVPGDGDVAHAVEVFGAILVALGVLAGCRVGLARAGIRGRHVAHPRPVPALIC